MKYIRDFFILCDMALQLRIILHFFKNEVKKCYAGDLDERRNSFYWFILEQKPTEIYCNDMYLNFYNAVIDLEHHERRW